MKNKAYLRMLPREEAQKMWLAKLADCGYFDNVPQEDLPTGSAVDRVIATSAYARRSVPHYNSAAMDGIAVRAVDTFAASDRNPQYLTVLPGSQEFQPASCYVINTGNMLPPGTDSVIMIEHVHFTDGKAEIMAPATPWQHVRIIGEDIVEHELIMPEFDIISPAGIAALLSAGLETVPVVARPIVSVIPTGNELVSQQKQLVPGKILDVNSHMLSAAITQCSAIPLRAGIAVDNYQSIKNAIMEGLSTSDMVLINAGTSAGTEDYTYQVLADIGEVLVHGVAIKPGKPVVLSICQNIPVIGLPGYPVSAMLAFDLFVKPVLACRQKLSWQAPPTITGKLARQLPSEIGVEEYLRVSIGNVNEQPTIVPLGRGAGVISSLMRAHGVLKVDEGTAGLPAGSTVSVDLFDKQSLQRQSLLAIGSHDLSLDILGLHLRRQGNVNLSCANVGSAGGVMAIRNGEAQLAGVHILDEATGQYNVSYLRKYLAGRQWRLVHLAQREQGLMIEKNNPHNITSVVDLVRPGIQIVNRQRGAGTRMLLDYLLKGQAIDPQMISGYEKEVGTHMAVAATIVAGAANAGMGIRAAADIMGLDFIPVAWEQYDLIVAMDGDQLFSLLISVLKSDKFRHDVESLGGYDLSNAGTVIAENTGV